MKFAIVLALLGVLLAPTLAEENLRRAEDEGPNHPPHDEGLRSPPLGENPSLPLRREGPPRGEGPNQPPRDESPRHPPPGEQPRYLIHHGNPPRAEGPNQPPRDESPRHPPVGEQPHYLIHHGNPRHAEGPNQPPRDESPRHPPAGEQPRFLIHHSRHPSRSRIPYRPRPFPVNRGFAIRTPVYTDNWKTVWDARTGFIATKVLGKNTCIISKADTGFNGFEGVNTGFLPPIEHRYVISNDRLLNLYPYGERIQRLCRGVPTYFAFASPGSNFSEDDASCIRNVFRNARLIYCNL